MESNPDFSLQLPPDDVAAIDQLGQTYQAFRAELGKIIIGQDRVIEQLAICLFARGHALLMGVPGLAKTLLVSSVAQTFDLSFSRIQFTPDLMPADITGTDIIQETGAGGRREFEFVKGPVFAHIVLADEINRAPAKTQSAMLEAMQENKVTVLGNTYTLKPPFFVLATQNPIEQEGTYPLPEAQVDRFMLKLVVSYPSKKEEKEILERMASGKLIQVNPVLDIPRIMALRQLMHQIYIDEKVKDYILDLVFATRSPQDYKLADLKPLISYGASPRASIMLTLAAKANAFLQGRGYVTPDDVKQIGTDVLRHRVLVTYEAEAEDITSDDIVKKIFDQVEVP